MVLDDPVELLTEPAGPGALLLVDADRVASADVGLLIRWCEASDGRRLALVGSEPSVERLRAAGAPIDEVLDWPLPERLQAPRDSDLSEIQAILGSGAGHDGAPTNGNGHGPARRNGDERGSSAPKDQTRVAMTRFAPRPGSKPRSAFLRSPIEPAPRREPPPPDEAPASPRRPGAATGPASDPSAAPRGLDPLEPLLTPEELDAFFQPLDLEIEPRTESDFEAERADVSELAPALPTELDPEPQVEEPESPAARATASPRPPWLKRQIADLADLVQALELRARSNHAHVGMESELARLRQFCKTLGLVASPPAHRAQRFDLAVHVEEQLGQLAGASPDSPRILFRTRGTDPSVEADKGLIACAVDAVLQTSLSCGGSGDVVRVQVVGDDAAVALDVEFPPGPLAGRAPAEVLEPYAIRDVLPQIGANALAAAGAIAVGQGGDLGLEERENGSLAFRLELLRATDPV